MEETKQLIPTAEAAAFLGIKVSYLHSNYPLKHILSEIPAIFTFAFRSAD